VRHIFIESNAFYAIWTDIFIKIVLFVLKHTANSFIFVRTLCLMQKRCIFAAHYKAYQTLGLCYTKLKELFGFCETLPAFQTLATLILRAIKLLLKNPKTFFNAV